MKKILMKKILLKKTKYGNFFIGKYKKLFRFGARKFHSLRSVYFSGLGRSLVKYKKSFFQ